MSAIEHDRRVTVILSADLKYGRGGQVVEIDATLNFRLNNVAVYVVAQIAVRREGRRKPGQESSQSILRLDRTQVVSAETTWMYKLAPRDMSKSRLPPYSGGF